MDHSYGGSGRRPPHITVNSGSGGDILNSDNNSSASDTGTPSTSRNLIPPPRPPTSGPQQSRMAAPQVYGSPDVAQSNEMLLPPTKSRSAANSNQPYSDYPMVSPSVSGFSSRRTSWSSEAGSRDSRLGPFGSPFDDSRASSRAGDSDDENINTQTVSEKYNIMPSAGLLLFPEDVEKDDYLHNPDPNEKEPRCDVCNRRGLVNVGGLVLITLATLALFIAYPVVTFASNIIDPTHGACAKAADCLSDKVALLKNVRTTLVDPDTPDSVKTKTGQDGKTLKLVFSDEFNTDGRTFYDGDDPYFQAMDMWYGATQDLEWYDPDAVTTGNGTLNIKFDAFQSHNLNYRSGMLQSWNKLCFKGGRVEASISLPGRGDWPGFWPGFWAMGNLARPGYQATTEGMWPYSYSDTCDLGITANQSASDGMSWLPGMKLPACTCKGQDHPSSGKSRSAPEIDALEASVGFIGPGGYEKGTGSASQSYQIAPFDIFYLPDYNYFEVYDHEQTGMSGYHGGNYQQAMSAVTWLNNDWYDGNGYQTYGFEYTPGADGSIAWFVGDQYTWKLDGRALRPNGNVGQRTVPEEPMALIMNLGMGTSFSQVMMPNLNTLFPATMRFDYIRIYQPEGSESVTCDPEGYPTTEYIKSHPEPYANVNLTSWDAAGYSWPTNSFVNGC
ncbi:glycoside hydrolase family 16 protein [Rutstroemia sp. NJR-2017a WRK4]|nr:glycoside hydrolase family 16 protein [Rutstroemia sp. NJR-2017a WRK4]